MVEPLKLGPRHCGQFSADAEIDANKAKARQDRPFMRKEFIVESCSKCNPLNGHIASALRGVDIFVHGVRPARAQQLPIGIVLRLLLGVLRIEGFCARGRVHSNPRWIESMAKIPLPQELESLASAAPCHRSGAQV